MKTLIMRRKVGQENGRNAVLTCETFWASINNLNIATIFPIALTSKKFTFHLNVCWALRFNFKGFFEERRVFKVWIWNGWPIQSTWSWGFQPPSFWSGFSPLMPLRKNKINRKMAKLPWFEPDTSCSLGGRLISVSKSYKWGEEGNPVHAAGPRRP